MIQPPKILLKEAGATITNKTATCVREAEQTKLLTKQEIKASFLYLCWYYGMNVFFASIGLLLLLVFLPLLAVLIYVDAPGPIFYTQERLGYKGSTFRMYKLRSMQARQDPSADFSWTARHDSRVTHMGRLLRAAHLDEIPQVINILRGEMSLIGPRPEVADCAAKLEALVPRYRQRLLVKPGLTGLAQVMHHYGDTLQDEETKLLYDFYYVEHQSFRLDVQILVRTVGEVLLRHGR